MYDEIIKERIENEEVTTFLDEYLSIFFKSNGWIAGGFGRIIYHFINKNSKYFYSKSSFDTVVKNYSSNGGDIDFFFQKNNIHFPKKLLYDNVKKSVTHISDHSSSFCCNFLFLERTLTLKVQIVEKFTYKDIKETFESFDIWNCCYAISKEDNEYYIHYYKKSVDLDLKNEVGIKHSNSPFTIQRVSKYLQYRGLLSISKCSEEYLSELLIRHVSSNFPVSEEVEKVFKCFNAYIERSIKYLFNNSFVKELTLLVIFIGRFKEWISPHGRYGPIVSIDWASKLLEGYNEKN